MVKAGIPKETKACTDPPPDGAATDAADAGAFCTSGALWNQGNTPSPLMNPGLAGTVYTALNEKDLCFGKPNLFVRVTASDGRVFDMQVNNAGNFSLPNMNSKPPFKAMVIDGAKARPMMGSVTSGDCNSCHTQTGKNGAPGRITAP